MPQTQDDDSPEAQQKEDREREKGAKDLERDIGGVLDPTIERVKAEKQREVDTLRDKDLWDTPGLPSLPSPSAPGSGISGGKIEERKKDFPKDPVT